MRILVTGATGLIGKALLPHLNHDEITVISRDPARAYQLLGHHINALDLLESLPNLDQFDVVINLAGEPIVGKRWSAQQKHVIEDSRWNITQQLVDKIQASDNPPHTFISGSAVGIYGNQHDQIIDETFNIAPDKTDFSQQVCSQWEQIALEAQSDKTRVCLLRTGIVLAKQGGALAKMLLPYQFGVGGPIGDGQQYFPWIQLQDMVRGILFLINHNDAQGPYNMTAPNPVTNRIFSATLAKTLHRPHLFFTPTWVLKCALGESSQLLLDGQRALPSKLLAAGFNFTFPEIEQALKQTLSD
ncbi:TIGR01777 family oxidoreductase [Photobacterium sp. S4TG1]|uniref:TIGR01777 family oxidoreductase n=1 Tax=Photobacterium sp. S4TG1 TaxID=3114587 RepID=UPI002E195F9F|nr:TIGR01777 family oxidoreductase [Photobacterium sp. S4TG1]